MIMNIKKLTAVFTTLCFLFTSVLSQGLYAVVEKRQTQGNLREALEEFIIPYSSGRITEARCFDSDKIVINIQDLHCHPEVQRNINKILSLLDNRYRLKNIYMEGASGDVDTSWIRMIEDKDLRQNVADSLIDTGKLTGAEYYSIISKKPNLLKGIEDEKIYISNLLRLSKILEKQKEISRFLPSVEQKLSALKDKYYTSKNRKLRKAVKKHLDKDLSTEKYYKLLIKYADKQEIPLYEYKSIQKFLELIELQKEINYKKVSSQISEFITYLKQKLPYNTYKQLLANTDNFSQTDKLYLYLSRIMDEHDLKLSNKFPYLAKFLKLINANQNVNPLELVWEERRLLKELQYSFSKSQTEREVVFLADYFAYLKEYFSNKISYENYGYFKRNLDEFKLLWAKYISIKRIPSLDPYYDLFDKYYQVNIKRNDCFLKNCDVLKRNDIKAQEIRLIRDIDHKDEIKKQLENSKDIVVVVTGGFHTPGLTEILKKQKTSYLVVTPNVTQNTEFAESVYNQIAKELAEIEIQQQKSLQNASLGIDSLAMKAYSQRLPVDKQFENIIKTSVESKLLLLFKQNKSINQITQEMDDFCKGFGGGFEYIEKDDQQNQHFVFTYTDTSVSKQISIPVVFKRVSAIVGKKSISKLDSSERLRDKDTRSLKTSSFGFWNKIPFVGKYIAIVTGVLHEKLHMGSDKTGKIFVDNDGRYRYQNPKEEYSIFTALRAPIGTVIIGIASIALAWLGLKDLPFVVMAIAQIIPVIIFTDGMINLTIAPFIDPESDVRQVWNQITKGIPIGALASSTSGRKVKSEELEKYLGKYGNDIVTYYTSRKALISAVTERDSLAYDSAYNNMIDSAKRIADSVRGEGEEEINGYKAVLESLKQDGRLNDLSISDEAGKDVIGPWDEILKAGGEKFTEDSHRKWIEESVDVLINAFPKEQKQAILNVRERIIENTFPYSGKHLVPSPKQMRDLMQKTKSAAELQSLKNFIFKSLNMAADFKYGFTVPYLAEPKIVMHAIEDKDWFCAIYMHEVGHYLSRLGIIDIPQMEIITHAISSIWLNGVDFPEFFNIGVEWGKANKEREIGIQDLQNLTQETVVKHWQKLGFPSLEAAMQLPFFIQMGQFSVEDYQRWVGAVLGGIKFATANEDKMQSLTDTLVWADTVLAKETEYTVRYVPDITRRNRIVKRIENSLQIMTGNKNLKLKEQKKIEGKKTVFTLSEDKSTIFYVPELLDHPDEDIAEALFYEQVFSVLFSEFGWVEPEYRNSYFMALFAAMELIRTRNIGLKKYKGLIKKFEKLNQALYPNVFSDSSKRKMNDFPLFIQFIEASIYEGRLDDHDPRITNKIVKRYLKITKNARNKMRNCTDIRQSYQIFRDEIWKKVSTLVKLSEKELERRKLKQKAKEEQGLQEQVPSPVQPSIPQKKQQQMQEQQLESLAKQIMSQMSPEQKEELAEQVSNELRNMLEQSIQGMGQGNQQVDGAQSQSQNEGQMETADSMEKHMSSAGQHAQNIQEDLDNISELVSGAKEKSENLERKAGQMRDSTGIKDLDEKDIDQLNEIADQIKEKLQDLQKESKALKKETASIDRNSQKMDSDIAPSGEKLKETTNELDVKSNELNEKSRDLNQKIQELEQRISNLAKLAQEQAKTPAQRTETAGIQENSKELKEEISDTKELADKSAQLLKETIEALNRIQDEIRKSKSQQQSGSAEEKQGEMAKDQKAKQTDQTAPTKQTSGSQDEQSGDDSQSQHEVPISDSTMELLSRLMQQKKTSGSEEQKRKDGSEIVDESKTVTDMRLSSDEQREMNEILNPLRAEADTFKGKIQKTIQETTFGREMQGLTSGKLDTRHLATYPIGNVFERDLLPGRVDHRIMIVIDTSGSMGEIYDKGSSLYHAVRTTLIMLLALKKIRGIEIGVMAYGDTPSRQLLSITRSEEINDVMLYKMYKKLQSGSGSTQDINTLDKVAEVISKDTMPQTLKTVLHFGDGNPDDSYLKEKVMKLYKKHADKKIKWASWGLGPDTEKMKDDYTPDDEIKKSVEKPFWPVADWIGDTEKLSEVAIDFVDKIFKEKRSLTALGENVDELIRLALTYSSPVSLFIRTQALKILGLQDDSELNRDVISNALRAAPELIQQVLELFFKGIEDEWLLDDKEAVKKYPDLFKNTPENIQIKVSRAPLNLIVQKRDAFAFATDAGINQDGKRVIIIHESLANTLKDRSPPLVESVLEHEVEETDFIIAVYKAIKSNGFTELKNKYNKLSKDDISFLKSNPEQAYVVFHKLTKSKYKEIFDLVHSIIEKQRNITHLGYVERNGKTYFCLKTPRMISPVEIEVNKRSSDTRIVKIYVKKGNEWTRLRPGVDISTIPDRIAYSIQQEGKEKLIEFKFNDDNIETLAQMLKTYSDPNLKNSNIGLVGPRGSGKNTIGYVGMGILGIPVRLMSLHAHVTQDDLRERKIIVPDTQNAKVKLNVNGKQEIAQLEIPSSKVESLLSEAYEAARLGEVVIIDETDKVLLPGHLSGLNSLFARINEKIDGMEHLHPDFRAIVFMNSHEGGDVQGQDLTMTAADFVDRVYWLDIGYMSSEKELDYVMSTVFNDITDEGTRKMMRVVMEAVISVANEIRNGVLQGKISRNLSTRGVLRIAKHLRYYPNDVKYFRSVFEKAYCTETITQGKEDVEDILNRSGLDNKLFPDDLELGTNFSYEVSRGKVYCKLGKGEWEVRILTAIKPEDLNEIKSGLKEHWHINANMVRFWQWMKDISLGNNIMVLGVPGTGKTVLIQYLLNDVLGYNSNYQVLTTATRGDDIFGTWKLKSGMLEFDRAKLPQAMVQGRPCILDEVDKPQDATALSSTNNIGQFGQVYLPDRSVVDSEAGFFMVMLGNLSDKGGISSQRISGEVLDRCSTYIQQPLTYDQLVEILTKYVDAQKEMVEKSGGMWYNISKDFIEALAKIHNNLHAMGNQLPRKPTMRTLEKVLDRVGRYPEDYFNIYKVYLGGYLLTSEWHKDLVKKECNKTLQGVAFKSWAGSIGESAGYDFSEEFTSQMSELKSKLDSANLPQKLSQAQLTLVLSEIAEHKGKLVWVEDEGAGEKRINTIVNLITSQMRLEQGHEDTVKEICKNIFPEINLTIEAMTISNNAEYLIKESKTFVRESEKNELLLKEEKQRIKKQFNDVISQAKKLSKKCNDVIAKGDISEDFIDEQKRELDEIQKLFDKYKEYYTNVVVVVGRLKEIKQYISQINDKWNERKDDVSKTFNASVKSEVDAMLARIKDKSKSISDMRSQETIEVESVEKIFEEAKNESNGALEFVEIATKGEEVLAKTVLESENGIIVQSAISVLKSVAEKINADNVISHLISALKQNKHANEVADIVVSLKLSDPSAVASQLNEFIEESDDVNEGAIKVWKHLSKQDPKVLGEMIQARINQMIKYVNNNRDDDYYDRIWSKWQGIEKSVRELGGDWDVYIRKNIESLIELYLACVNCGSRPHYDDLSNTTKGVAAYLLDICKNRNDLIEENDLYEILNGYSKITGGWGSGNKNDKWFPNENHTKAFGDMVTALTEGRAITKNDLYKLIEYAKDYRYTKQINDWMMPLWERSIEGDAWSLDIIEETEIAYVNSDEDWVANSGWERVFKLIEDKKSKVLYEEIKYTPAKTTGELNDLLSVAARSKNHNWVKAVLEAIQASDVGAFTQETVPTLIEVLKRDEYGENMAAALIEISKSKPPKAFKNKLEEDLISAIEKGESNEHMAGVLTELTKGKPTVLTAMLNANLSNMLEFAKYNEGGCFRERKYNELIEKWKNTRKTIDSLNTDDLKNYSIKSKELLVEIYLAVLLFGPARCQDSRSVDTLKGIGDCIRSIGQQRNDLVNKEDLEDFLQNFEKLSKAWPNKDYLHATFFPSDGVKEGFNDMIRGLSAGKTFDSSEVRKLIKYVKDYGHRSRLNSWLMPAWEKSVKDNGWTLELVEDEEIASRNDDGDWIAEEGWEDVLKLIEKEAPKVLYEDISYEPADNADSLKRLLDTAANRRVKAAMDAVKNSPANVFDESTLPAMIDLIKRADTADETISLLNELKKTNGDYIEKLKAQLVEMVRNEDVSEGAIKICLELDKQNTDLISALAERQLNEVYKYAKEREHREINSSNYNTLLEKWQDFESKWKNWDISTRKHLEILIDLYLACIDMGFNSDKSGCGKTALGVGKYVKELCENRADLVHEEDFNKLLEVFVKAIDKWNSSYFGNNFPSHDTHPEAFKLIAQGLSTEQKFSKDYIRKLIGYVKDYSRSRKYLNRFLMPAWEMTVANGDWDKDLLEDIEDSSGWDEVVELVKSKKLAKALGKNIERLILYVLGSMQFRVSPLYNEVVKLLKLPKYQIVTEDIVARLIRTSPQLVQQIMELFLKGVDDEYIMPESEVQDKYENLFEHENVTVKVSRAPIDTIAKDSGSFILATDAGIDVSGKRVIIVHELLADALKDRSPPDVTNAVEVAEDIVQFADVVNHETDESAFVDAVTVALRTKDFAALKQKYPALTNKDIRFLKRNPGQAYKVFHKINKDKDKSLFDLADEVINKAIQEKSEYVKKTMVEATEPVAEVSNRVPGAVYLTDEEVYDYFTIKQVPESVTKGKKFYIRKMTPQTDQRYIDQWKKDIEENPGLFEKYGKDIYRDPYYYPYALKLFDNVLYFGLFSESDGETRLEGHIGIEAVIANIDLYTLFISNAENAIQNTGDFAENPSQQREAELRKEFAKLLDIIDPASLLAGKIPQKLLLQFIKMLYPEYNRDWPIETIAPALADKNWVVNEDMEYAKDIAELGINAFCVKSKGKVTIDRDRDMRAIVPMADGQNILADVWLEKEVLQSGKEVYVLYYDVVEGNITNAEEFKTKAGWRIAKALENNPLMQKQLTKTGKKSGKFRIDVYEPMNDHSSIEELETQNRKTTFVYGDEYKLESILERLNLIERSVKRKSGISYIQGDPIFSGTFDMERQKDAWELLNDANFIKMLKETMQMDTIVLKSLPKKMTDAQVKQMKQILNRLNNEGLRVVFDKQVTTINLRSLRQSAKEIMELMNMGITNGFRIDVSKADLSDPETVQILTKWLTDMRNTVNRVNPDAIIGLINPKGFKFSATDKKHVFETLKIRNVIRFTPGEQLDTADIPYGSWLEMHLGDDMKGVEFGTDTTFKLEFEKLFKMYGVNIFSIDFRIMDAAKNMFTNDKSFAEYCSACLNKIKAEFEKDPIYLYNKGRNEAVASKVSDFEDVQSLITVCKSKDINQLNELYSKLTGSRKISKSKLPKEQKEIDRFIGYRSGYIYGILENIVTARYIEQNRQFSDPAITKLFGHMGVESLLILGDVPEALPEIIDNLNERPDETRKSVDRLLQIIEEEVNSGATMGEIYPIIMENINVLTGIVNASKPGTAPVSIAAILDILDKYAYRDEITLLDEFKNRAVEVMPMAVERIVSAA